MKYRFGQHGKRCVWIIDALRHSESSILYCELGEFDTEGILGDFARREAIRNIHRVKPYCSGKNYKLIIQWLKTGDESIREEARKIAGKAEAAAMLAVEKAETAAGEEWLSVDAASSIARSAADKEWAKTGTAWTTAWTAIEIATSEIGSGVGWITANAILSDMIQRATGWDLKIEWE